jgi:acetylglutamate/LysW-gamma-L-alpha-aminoadipate kinase
VPGLLANFPDPDSLIRQVTPQPLANARAAAQGRMKRKVLAAEEALAGGVSQVILADAHIENPVTTALAGAGTVFSNQFDGGHARIDTNERTMDDRR